MLNRSGLGLHSRICALAALTFLFSFGSKVQGQSTEFNFGIDERTELLSTVFRLAECPEFMSDEIPNYSRNVDVYFAEYKNHDAVKFIKEMRAAETASFDAVMAYALYILIDNDSLFLNKNISDEMLKRDWNKENIPLFAEKLGRFYRDSRFNTFFSSKKEYYEKVEKNLESTLDSIDFQWIDNFYGKQRINNYHLIISLLNGDVDYKIPVKSIQGDEHVFLILGASKIDKKGIPYFDLEDLSYFIHEYNEFLCKETASLYAKRMGEKGERWYKEIADNMRNYECENAQEMYCESLIKAVNILYLTRNEKDEKLKKKYCTIEKNRGFLWIDDFVKEMEIYSKKREKYPQVEDFAVELAKHTEQISLSKLQKEYKKSCPKIVRCNITNNANNIDPSIKEIIIEFDKPMSTELIGNSCFGEKGQAFFPKLNSEKTAYWNQNNKKQFSLPVDLQPDKEYSIAFPGIFFSSEENYTMEGVYSLNFKTKP